MAYKIETWGMIGHEICMVCGKSFEYISDGETVPTCCEKCPSPFEAMCDRQEVEEVPTVSVEYQSCQLVSDLLEAHTEMVCEPARWTTNNVTKTRYYGLLNRVRELVKAGVAFQQSRDAW